MFKVKMNLFYIICLEKGLEILCELRHHISFDNISLKTYLLVLYLYLMWKVTFNVFIHAMLQNLQMNLSFTVLQVRMA